MASGIGTKVVELLKGGFIDLEKRVLGDCSAVGMKPHKLTNLL
jgi:hypothetical protein